MRPISIPIGNARNASGLISTPRLEPRTRRADCRGVSASSRPRRRCRRRVRCCACPIRRSPPVPRPAQPPPANRRGRQFRRGPQRAHRRGKPAAPAPAGAPILRGSPVPLHLVEGIATRAQVLHHPPVARDCGFLGAVPPLVLVVLAAEHHGFEDHRRPAPDESVVDAQPHRRHPGVADGVLADALVGVAAVVSVGVGAPLDEFPPAVAVDRSALPVVVDLVAHRTHGSSPMYQLTSSYRTSRETLCCERSAWAPQHGHCMSSTPGSTPSGSTSLTQSWPSTV